MPRRLPTEQRALTTSIQFTADEVAFLDQAVDVLGLRSRSAVVRRLLPSCRSPLERDIAAARAKQHEA